jgi:hypothetical protein
MIESDLFDRLFDRAMVNEETGCWEFSGTLVNGGYGQISHKNKGLLAHRVAYELVVAYIPDGMLVLHSCDNPPCVNPQHLFLGTHQDNSDDCVAKGRIAHNVGSLAGAAKLTEEDVLKIKERLSARMTQRRIAEEFGVAPSAITRIKKGLYWRHLQSQRQSNPDPMKGSIL